MVKASLTMVEEPDLGLILLHLPIPHWPPIFDRTSGRITLFNLRKDWYFDNLLLADEVLGEIRAAMERSGQWEKSALIVTSDHSLRPSMMAHPNPTPLVPFMVKMPRQTTGMTFDAPFNTILTRDLIVAILSGKVTSESLPGWLQAMSASSEAEAQ